jgi:hypothetical protein
MPATGACARSNPTSIRRGLRAASCCAVVSSCRSSITPGNEDENARTITGSADNAAEPDKPDAEPAQPAGGYLTHVPRRCIGLLDDCTRRRFECRAGGRELHAPPRPRKERHAELAFETLHLPAQGRLRDPKLSGRPPEVEGVGNGQEA